MATTQKPPVAWSATTVYTAGMTVIEDGVTYQANWWVQGTDPAHNSGGAGTGRPWTVVAAVDPAHAVPTVPTGLAATAASTNTATLSWNASSMPGNAPMTGYAIFENGQQIATTTGTSYTATNLAANTDYQFSVTAIDAAGSSTQASPISVHTAAASSAGGSGGSGSGSLTREFAPAIDMLMPVDADLAAISKASGVQNFMLAFVVGSSQGFGWQGTGTIADDMLSNGTTIQSQVQAVQAAGGHITVSFGGANGQEAAFTAPSAAALQAEYLSVPITTSGSIHGEGRRGPAVQ
jgi:chitinase